MERNQQEGRQGDQQANINTGKETGRQETGRHRSRATDQDAGIDTSREYRGESDKIQQALTDLLDVETKLLGWRQNGELTYKENVTEVCRLITARSKAINKYNRLERNWQEQINEHLEDVVEFMHPGGAHLPIEVLVAQIFGGGAQGFRASPIDH